MATMIIQHDVADYDQWRAVFDGAESLRTGHGCTSNRVLRSHESENRVTVLQEFKDIADAHRFASDPELASTMAAAGVAGAPSIDFVSEA